MTRLAWGLALVAAVTIASAMPPRLATAAEINVYSSRHYDTDESLFRTFTERTGITVNLIEGEGNQLIERMTAEGRNSPADVLITVDAGNMWRADQAGLFQPVRSEVLESRIPANLRHPEGHWFGLTMRARIFVYSQAAGRPEGLDSYEDLADPAYRGMVCSRSSSNIYSQSLLASIIAAHGEAAAEEWARGVVANFARPPEGNDTAQIRAVAAGQCRVAVVNSYYVGRLMASSTPADAEIGRSVGVIFPNQDDRGTHVNISGAGVAAHAPNRDGAIAFLEYMVEDEAQRLFAEGNNEYPVVEGVAVSGPIAELGTFRQDPLSAAVLGENNPLGVQIFDRAGWR